MLYVFNKLPVNSVTFRIYYPRSMTYLYYFPVQRWTRESIPYGKKGLLTLVVSFTRIFIIHPCTYCKSYKLYSSYVKLYIELQNGRRHNTSSHDVQGKTLVAMKRPV